MNKIESLSNKDKKLNQKHFINRKAQIFIGQTGTSGSVGYSVRHGKLDVRIPAATDVSR